MKTIEITISPSGETKLETLGFNGLECQNASARLEQALGVKSSDTLKPEFYENSQSNENEQHMQG